MLISAKYLTLPASRTASLKHVCLYDGERLVFDFKCKIDLLEPTFCAYVDVSAFIGKELRMTVSPHMDCTPNFVNDMDIPDLYKESLRPQIHFTVKNGWNNDPNGLIYANGVYHMFYQYNPAAPEWENMHWGHAVSTDLVHWEEKDIALFPDEYGTMYSGSAFTDTENATGLGKDAMLLFYTAAGSNNKLSSGKRFTQCLAYSTDGGCTFTKYASNPIIPHIEAQNRDPKVVYASELNKYVMAIYLAYHRYELFTSDNLTDWKHYDYVTFETDAECPDLFPLECEGERLWVLMGALDCYKICRFTDTGIEIVNEEKRLTHLRMSYAAQSFSGIPDGRIVRIAWHIAGIPARNFTSQMGFPTEMHLKKENGTYYLHSLPVKEIGLLYENTEKAKDITLNEALALETGKKPVHLKLCAKYVEGKRLTVNLLGTPVLCDMAANEIRCKNARLPLSLNKDKLELEIISDRCSVEIFADGGRYCAAVASIADHNLPRITLEANEALTVDNLECHTLKSIHE